MLVHEEEITLHLLVESIGKVHAASVAGAWLGPDRNLGFWIFWRWLR